VAPTLPRLRVDLDMLPSPVPGRPGLLIRDPYGYAEQTLIIPPPLVPALRLFDGEKTSLDLREALVRATGQIEVSEIIAQLTHTLENGFVMGERLEELRERRHRDFAAASQRLATHAGAAYPDSADDLRRQLTAYLEETTAGPKSLPGLIGIAAPHVSLEAGFRSYAAAYAALGENANPDGTFVILGTSHYGTPNRFGLTRKPFATPLGETRADAGAVESLLEAAPGACIEEDYCHAVEHSIEFQVVFLQHLFGANVSVIPILCGPLVSRVNGEGLPEDEPAVAAFLEALASWAEAREQPPCWILGIDLAHIGRRYGDRDPVQADRGAMRDVAIRDRERLERVEEADAAGFWELVRENGDELRWCGASPLYTFLRAAPPGVRGTVELYEQWNIDEASVVSFAAVTFSKAPAAPGDRSSPAAPAFFYRPARARRAAQSGPLW